MLTPTVHLIQNFEHPLSRESFEVISVAIAKACSRIWEMLSLSQINVLVRPESWEKESPLKIVWYCDRKDTVWLKINMDSFDINADDVELLVWHTMSHELNHAERISTVWYGKSLYEAMLSEWLASAFELYLYPEAPALWTKSSPDELRIIADLLPKENISPYDHTGWFYSREVGNDSIPNWAWYKLGYFLVSKIQERTGKTIPDLTHLSFQELSPIMGEEIGKLVFTEKMESQRLPRLRD